MNPPCKGDRFGRTPRPFSPWPTSTRLAPPSPTPRALRSVVTPTRSGASNLDAIMDEGTLTIGWVGPALLGILIAACGWARRVFEWLGTLPARSRY